MNIVPAATLAIVLMLERASHATVSQATRTLCVMSTSMNVRVSLAEMAPFVTTMSMTFSVTVKMDLLEIYVKLTSMNVLALPACIKVSASIWWQVIAANALLVTRGSIAVCSSIFALVYHVKTVRCAEIWLEISGVSVHLVTAATSVEIILTNVLPVHVSMGDDVGTSSTVTNVFAHRVSWAPDVWRMSMNAYPHLALMAASVRI